MSSLRGDGREDHIRSDFEEIRLAIEARDSGVTEHPLLTARADGVDVDMSLLYDYNHSVDVRLGNATDVIQLIPSTTLEDVVMMHQKCRGCWSRHGARWTPDILKSLSHNTTSFGFNFMYAMHYYHTELTGHFWKVNMCLDSKLPNCALDMIVFAIERAKPWMNILTDGYLGLAPSRKHKKGATHNNALE